MKRRTFFQSLFAAALAIKAAPIAPALPAIEEEGWIDEEDDYEPTPYIPPKPEPYCQDCQYQRIEVVGRDGDIAGLVFRRVGFCDKCRSALIYPS